MRPDEGWYSLPLVLLTDRDHGLVNRRCPVDSRAGRAHELPDLGGPRGALWGYLECATRPAGMAGPGSGCTIAAFILIEAVGASLPNTTPGLTTWFQATANSVTQAYLDLTWRHQVSTFRSATSA